MQAAVLGMHRYVKVLIEDGSEIDARDDEGATALLLATAINHFETAEQLLNAGADIDAADIEGATPLTQAAWRGYVKLLKLLIARHASLDPLHGEQKLTPLMNAALAGNLEVAKVLLSGADPTPRRPDGGPPLSSPRRAGFRRTPRRRRGARAPCGPEEPAARRAHGAGCGGPRQRRTVIAELQQAGEADARRRRPHRPHAPRRPRADSALDLLLDAGAQIERRTTAAHRVASSAVASGQPRSSRAAERGANVDASAATARRRSCNASAGTRRDGGSPAGARRRS
jgi:hypothetical protein